MAFCISCKRRPFPKGIAADLALGILRNNGRSLFDKLNAIGNRLLNLPEQDKATADETGKARLGGEVLVLGGCGAAAAKLQMQVQLSGCIAGDNRHNGRADRSSRRNSWIARSLLP